MEVICFFAGILFQYTSAWILFVVLLAALWIGASFHIVVFFIFGLIWAGLHHHLTYPQVIQTFHKKVGVKGIVSTIPKITGSKTQFKFQLDHVQSHLVSGEVWLTCYRRCPTIQVGETWAFLVYFNQPTWHGLSSEQSFKNWLISNHILGLGQFNTKGAHRLYPSTWQWGIQRLRTQIAERLHSILKNDPTLGILQGLTLGLGQSIDKSQWDLFRRTGTTHLVVISGEHISLVAGTCFFLMSFLWKRAGQLALVMPAQRAASLLAGLMACLYAFIAGLGAPVERALLGFGLILLRYFLPVSFTRWQIWCYTLLIVVLLEPHTVLTPGFYLSFTAVAVLFLTSQRFPSTNKLKELIFLQFFCLLCLLPFTLFFFSYGAINSFFVNIFAIPLVGWFIVPSALLGTILFYIYPWEGWLWIAKEATTLLLNILHYFDKSSWINLENIDFNQRRLIACTGGIALICLLPIRRLMPIYCLLVLCGLS